MKRSSHRSGYATVLGFQLGERPQRSLVADHARDLPPTGRIGGLALRAGLGLGHGLVVRRVVAKRGRFFGADCDAVTRGVADLLEESAACVDAHKASGLWKGFAPSSHHGLKHRTTRPNGGQNALGPDGADRGGRVAVHGLLRSVTVEPSYLVTSDYATTVRRGNT